MENLNEQTEKLIQDKQIKKLTQEIAQKEAELEKLQIEKIRIDAGISKEELSSFLKKIASEL